MKKLVFLLIALGCAISLSAQWHFHNPLPQGNTLRDVFFFDLSNGLTAGDGGTLLKTRDGGSSWDFVTLPTKNDLYAITFIGSHIGFICGSGGTILRTSDGGESWEEMTSGTSITLRDICFHSSPRGYAVGDNGTILITNDCGFSWNALNSSTTFNLHSLYCLDPLEAFVVGDNGTILYSSDGGARWEAQQSGTIESLFKVIFKNEYRGWITGNAGIILKTFNAGESWLQQESGTPVGLNGLCMCDEEKGWAVGQGGTILYTTDGGEQWTSQPSNSDQSLNAVCAVDDQNCFIAGDNGDQFLTNDGGKTWISQSSGFHDPGNLRFAGFTDDLHGWACDNGSEIVQTNDGGITWTVNGSSNEALDIIFTDHLEGWSLSGINQNVIFYTEDGGITWDTNYYNNGTERYSSIFFINPDTGWVGGSIWEDNTKYLMLKTTDGGNSWSRKICPRPLEYYASELYDLFFASESRGWAIGSTFGMDQNWQFYWKVEMLKTSNGGQSWSVIPTELNPFGFFYARLFFIENTGFVTSDNGNLYKSTTSGSTWTLLENLGGVTDIFFSDPDNGRVVGWNGAVLQTTDGGNNWIQEQCPTGNTLDRILFTDNGDGWIFGENSSILHLADSTMVSVNEPVSPESFKVAAFPNPFSGSASISYFLDEECYVKIEIYNYSGQLIDELGNEKQSKGNHQVLWNGENLSSGIYFYRIIAGNHTYAGRIEKLK